MTVEQGKGERIRPLLATSRMLPTTNESLARAHLRPTNPLRPCDPDAGSPGGLPRHGASKGRGGGLGECGVGVVGTKWLVAGEFDRCPFGLGDGQDLLDKWRDNSASYLLGYDYLLIPPKGERHEGNRPSHRS